MYSNKNTSYKEKMPARVYHYCCAEAFVNIMKESSFRLSNIIKSNDKEEVIHIQPKVCRVLYRLTKSMSDCLDEQITAEKISNLVENQIDVFNKNLYVICFSEEDDLLSNWEMYADKGKGFAIGINPYLLNGICDSYGPCLTFGRVCYNKDIEGEAENYIRPLIKENNGILNSFALEDIIFKTMNHILCRAVYYKNFNFSSEKEWRLVLNPLQGINKVNSYEAYFDRISEIGQRNSILNDTVTIGELNFKVSNSKKAITSFHPLFFDKVKTDFIRNVMIGPNMQLSPYDVDLRLFMHECGYRVAPPKSSNSVLLKSSAIPYQSF